MVERGADALALRVQAELLGISRRSLYYQPVAAIKHRIAEQYTAHPFYGSRKLTVPLAEQFGPSNRKRAQQPRIFPYLLQGVTAAVPKHVWSSDIAYVRLRTTWLYPVAVLDWFSRYVSSWTLDDTLALPFVLEAAGLALATPQTWNTDHGSHCTSPQLTTLLEAAGARISMDGTGRTHDNNFTERLWRTVKYEEIYLADNGRRGMPAPASLATSRFTTRSASIWRWLTDVFRIWWTDRQRAVALTHTNAAPS